MKNKHISPIPASDISLFAKMAREYSSEEERTFFEKLAFDEANTPTICGQVYIHEDDNKDKIFFIRRNSHEYELDNAVIYSDDVESGGYYDSLSETLSVFLDEIRLHQEHITFMEWLRANSYSCVKYDCNFDTMG